jgi:DNA-binding XRE family transcriptional regulator
MERRKKKRLERAGWRVGTASTFLELTTVEEHLVDMKLTLGARLRKAREQRHLTQTELAKRMGSSQSRVAKMEAGDPAVSLDLLVQGLLAAGATRREIATALGPRKKVASAQRLNVELRGTRQVQR